MGINARNIVYTLTTAGMPMHEIEPIGQTVLGSSIAHK